MTALFVSFLVEACHTNTHTHMHPLRLRSTNGLHPVRGHRARAATARNTTQSTGPIMSNGKTIIEYRVQMAEQRRQRQWTSADRLVSQLTGQILV